MQVQDLPLHFMDSTLLLPVVVEHTIDERSPLYGTCSLAPQPPMPSAVSVCPSAHVVTDAGGVVTRYTELLHGMHCSGRNMCLDSRLLDVH
jgi:hypothetical protein